VYEYNNNDNPVYIAPFARAYTAEALILRPCQHDDGSIDSRSHIRVQTDERTQVHTERCEPVSGRR